MFGPGLYDKLVYSCSLLLSRWINGKRDPRQMEFRNILLIRQDEIGDLCYSLHVFSLLRERYPEAKLTLWCKPFSATLAAGDPNLNRIITSAPSGEHFDLIVDLRGFFSGLRFAFFNQPEYRLERGIVRLRNRRKGKHPHEVLTNFEIIQPLLHQGTPMRKPEFHWKSEDAAAVALFLEKKQPGKFAILHCGARKELRKWPRERYATIAKYLHEKMHLNVVMCGDKTDLADIEWIQSQCDFTVFSVAGKLSLGGLAALCKEAKLYIGNESGPLHIAALSGLPTIGLFGPGEPHVFYPYGDNSRVLHHVLPCNPCRQVTCIHPDNPCIQRISVEDVKVKIAELLGG